MDEFEIRGVRVGDLPAVAAIYNEQVREGIATFDVDERGVEHFAPRLSPCHPGDLFLVARDSGGVAGFAYSGPFRPRPAHDGTRETSVYVAARARGRGLARRLYTELLGRLDEAGVHTEIAVIALPNDASEALHRTLGFVHVGTLQGVGHKFGRYIDTAWYQRMP